MRAKRSRGRKVTMAFALVVTAAAGSCGGSNEDRIESVAVASAEADEGVGPDNSTDDSSAATTDVGEERTDPTAGTEQSPSSTPDGATIPIEQWRVEMHAVCRATEEDMAVLFVTGEFDEEAFVETWQRQAEAIRSLPRPRGHEQAVEELSALFDQFGEQLAAAVEAGVALPDLPIATPDTELGSRLEALSIELGVGDCGEDADAGAELCDLVPDELVMTVLGVVPEPEFDGQLAARGCTWAVDDAKLAVQTGSADVYALSLDHIRESGEPLDGLGDEALVVPGYSSVTGGSTRGTTIWVVSGDTVVAVGAMVNDTTIEADQLRPVVELVLAELATQ